MTMVGRMGFGKAVLLGWMVVLALCVSVAYGGCSQHVFQVKGMTCEGAKQAILEICPELTVSCVQNGSRVTLDYNPNRVRIPGNFKDGSDSVSNDAIIG
mmetsp:Transcript_9415/g.19843  ORF Transcript_9415/g.19843 Transcript_9415/m.19843 type:complete len:99 (+) Transcript_9415:128-424(+)